MQKYEISGLTELTLALSSMSIGIYSSIPTNNPHYILVCGGAALFIDGFIRQADRFGGIERFFKYLKKDKETPKHF